MFSAFDFDYNPHGHWFSFLLVHHYSDANLIKKLKWNNPTVLLTYLHTGKIRVRLFFEFGKENSIFFINYFLLDVFKLVPFYSACLEIIWTLLVIIFFIPNISWAIIILDTVLILIFFSNICVSFRKSVSRALMIRKFLFKT